jgi:fructose 1,6-bisphosphatase
MSKLWEKNTKVNDRIEAYTVGRDREMDLFSGSLRCVGFNGAYYHARVGRVTRETGARAVAC